eukprot:scaffold87493_cov25-Tisochrysis_lutea.AAC.8
MWHVCLAAACLMGHCGARGNTNCNIDLCRCCRSVNIWRNARIAFRCSWYRSRLGSVPIVRRARGRCGAGADYGCGTAEQGLGSFLTSDAHERDCGRWADSVAGESAEAAAAAAAAVETAETAEAAAETAEATVAATVDGAFFATAFPSSAAPAASTGCLELVDCPLLRAGHSRTTGTTTGGTSPCAAAEATAPSASVPAASIARVGDMRVEDGLEATPVPLPQDWMVASAHMEKACCAGPAPAHTAVLSEAVPVPVADEADDDPASDFVSDSLTVAGEPSDELAAGRSSASCKGAAGLEPFEREGPAER